MEPRYDIILPTYGQPELIQKCVTSVEKHSKSSFQLIWIDNGHDIQGFDWRGWPANGNTLHLVGPSKNIGYTKAINVGLALSTAPYVVLMNSDTAVVTWDWLSKMAECFEYGRLAAVTPACDNPAQGPAGQLPKNTGFHRVGPHPIDHGWGYDVKLSFWCIMIQREAILDVGYLDERFSPGCGEDDDWLLRAHLRGWALGVQTDVLVTHTHPHASWDAAHRGECSARAADYLKRKYAGIIGVPA